MTESETFQRIAGLIKDRRKSPRFEGRRSGDKQCGEVVEIMSESLDTAIVERIALPNFKGEAAASERATIKSDEWAASQIMALFSQSVQFQRIATLEKHLRKLWDEYETQACQFGSEYLWQKFEDAEAIKEIQAFVGKIEEG